MSPAPVTAADITVSIVSYNTRDLLRACLLSLRACREDGLTLDVIVADNGSADGSPAMVRAEFPEVRVLETGGNIGYGAANNAAVAEASGRYVCILNSDTEVGPDALRALRDALVAEPTLGAVAPQLVGFDGRPQLSCARMPTPLAVFWEQTYLYKLLPIRRVLGEYDPRRWTSAPWQPVDWVPGACLMARRDAYRQISGFAPEYFMYYEDVDLCQRLRASGWSVGFLPKVSIRHHLGASSTDWQHRARMIVSYNQSRLRFFRAHGGPGPARLVRASLMAGTLLRLLAWALLAPFYPPARTQVRLSREVWRRTFTQTGDAP